MYQEVQWSKDKQQLKESVTNRSAVQETLKGVLYGEGKNDDRWKHGNVWQMNWKSKRTITI